jgi:hypothetical protein
VKLSDYVIRVINGQKIPAMERGLKFQKRLQSAVKEMLGLLCPRDFEILVDLYFSKTG